MRWLLALWLALWCTAIYEGRVDCIESQQDIECIALTLHMEARGESDDGQRAVYDVVRHRMVARKLTACQVVAQAHQFPWYSVYGNKLVTQQMLTNYDKIRKMKSVVADAEYFHADYVKPTWRHKMKKLLQIGKHIFYGEKPKTEKEKTK